MAFSITLQAQKDDGAVHWTSNGVPVEAAITGGPWTLEQSGAANGLKSSGYCDASGNPINNPGTERMQPYYFPVIVGHGKHLQGYFDWRPKDTEEGVVAASSDDAGFSWNFQQKVLDLNLAAGRVLCPNQVNKEPDGENEKTPDPNNSDEGDDDGQGHQFIIHLNGQTILYTLVRSVGHIDSDGLYVHYLTPQPGAPLTGAPAADDGPTDTNPNTQPVPPTQTAGLLNPDGILGVVPGSNPLMIIYEQKILKGDNTGGTAYPANQQCNTFWAGFYAANGGLSPNDDITYLRLASTTDGIHFKDLGTLQGLHDPTTVSATGTRWLATAGTLIHRKDGKWGLLFSGGSCIDADSDSFHYIGYAESTDLVHWTVINGFNNPIASVAPFTLTVNGDGVPASSGTTIMAPSQTPVVGNAIGWLAGRVYAPSATLLDENDDITVVFAGYHTQKPKNGLGDYRTIGRFSLHSSKPLATVGQDNGTGGDSDEQ
jgi:hypothetical protein